MTYMITALALGYGLLQRLNSQEERDVQRKREEKEGRGGCIVRHFSLGEMERDL